MVPEPKLTANEIVEQAGLYVILASNGECIIRRSVNISGNVMDGLQIVHALREEADYIEALVFG